MTIAKALPVEKLCAYLRCHPDDFDAAYTQLRRKLIKYFQWKRCREASELADESMLRVIEALGREREIQNFGSFVLRIAQNVLADWIRGEIKVSALRRQTEAAGEPEWFPPDPPEEAVCLEGCLRSLAPEDREFIEACFVDKQRAALARRLNLTKNAIRMRIFKLKRRLRACTKDCLEARSGRV